MDPLTALASQVAIEQLYFPVPCTCVHKHEQRKANIKGIAVIREHPRFQQLGVVAREGGQPLSKVSAQLIRLNFDFQ